MRVFLSLREFGFETDKKLKQGEQVTIVVTGKVNQISTEEVNVSVETAAVTKGGR